MRIYTKRGDEGLTDLANGERVSKSDSRVMAYGAVDEANATIGIALGHIKDDKIAEVLESIQSDLFVVGAELAGTPPDSVCVSSKMVEKLESIIDEFDAKLEPLSNFIMPGGGLAGAHLHAARAIVRRAESLAVSIDPKVRAECLAYMNRISDLLFVMARYANASQSAGERVWSRKDTL